MDPSFDVAKFVGAASAPVVLIIATAIFLSNLTTRWLSLSGMFRQLAGEYREMDRDGSVRSDKVKRQIGYCIRRLRLLQRATAVLTVAILLFILTVLFTGLNVLVPENPTLIILTIFFSVTGLLLLGAAVTIEMIQNGMVNRSDKLEIEEFPELLDAEQQTSISPAK